MTELVMVIEHFPSGIGPAEAASSYRRSFILRVAFRASRSLGGRYFIPLTPRGEGYQTSCCGPTEEKEEGFVRPFS